MNRLDAEGVFVGLVLQNQLFQIEKGLFVLTPLPHLYLDTKNQLNFNLKKLKMQIK